MLTISRIHRTMILATMLTLLLCMMPLAEAWGRSSPQKKPTAKGFPVHPRVDINWTQGIVNYNMTKEERDTIMSHNLVLTKLVVLNRHGHRAPNAPYWDMCKPDRKNLRHYKDVNPEDLTAMGMQEEYDFGLYLRHKYKDFLGDRFNRTMHYFRAVGEPRILQSAMAVAQALFPDGFGPGGYLPSRPQFVPIFSDMDTHEYLLDDVPCFRRAERDSHWWIENKFDQFVKDPEVADVLNYLQAVCKAKHTDYKPFAFIKTVADGMTFNHDLGLQLAKGKVTEDWLYRIRNVSLQLLMQRLYTSDEQQTYTVVDLPNTLLTLLNHTHVGMGPQTMDFRDTRQEATLFFVHREALYAFAQFFGIQYRVAGLPPGEVPVASSVIIEKFMPEKNQFSHDETKVYIRMSLWTPRTGASVIPVVACRIPELCEFSELRRIYTTRIQRTGTWEKLCNYTPQEIDHTTDIR